MMATECQPPQSHVQEPKIMEHKGTEPSGHSIFSGVNAGDQNGLRQRTQPPQFRQSKRWSKMYGANSTPRPKTAPEDLSAHSLPDPDLTYDIAGSMTQPVSPAQTSRVITEHIDSKHHCKGLCRATSVPTWQQFRQAHMTCGTKPSKTARLAVPKDLRLVRVVPTSETQASPQRAALPHMIKSKDRVPQRSAIPNESSATNIETAVPSKNESGNTFIEEELPKEDATAGKASVDATDFWNDPHDSRRWSQDCRAILRGEEALDFNSDWKPEPLVLDEFLVPQDSLHAEDYATKHAIPSRTMKSIPTAHIAHLQPPERVSSRGISIAKLAHMTRFGRPSIMLGRSDVAYPNNDGDEDEDIPKAIAFSKAAQRHVRTYSRSSLTQRSRVSNKMLKAAKSIDSMAQIEAHLNSVSLDSQVLDACYDNVMQKLKNKPMPGKTPEKKILPAGAPPERPLPALPSQHNEGELLAHQSPGRKTRRKGRPAVNETRDHRRHSRMSSIQRIMIVPNDDNSTSLQFKEADTEERPSSNAGTIATTIDPDLSVRFSSKSFSNTNTPRSMLNARLKVKDLPIERVDKVRNMKRKHVAARSREKYAAKEISPAANNIILSEDASPYSRKHGGDTTMVGTATSCAASSEPPQSNANHHQHSRHAYTNSGQIPESDDDFPLFPAPPVSRPVSHASNIATLGSIRSTSRGSTTNLSSRRTRSRLSNAQDRHLFTSLLDKNGSKQVLSRSSIMIVCDTNPKIAVHRAVTTSPIFSGGCSPEGSHLMTHPSFTSSHLQTELENIDELAGLDEIVDSYYQQTQHSQTRPSSGRTERSNPRPTSPGSLSTRPVSKQATCLILQSDSELETISKSRLACSVSKSSRTPSTRPGSKASNKSRTTHRQKVKPTKDAFGEGTADVQEMLRVLSRYAGKGNSVARQMLDKSHWIAHDEVRQDQTSSNMVMQNPNCGVTPEQELLPFQREQTSERPTSGTSTVTANATDTDTSWPLKTPPPAKGMGTRSSAGSLTDPTDYELAIPSRHAVMSNNHESIPPQSPDTFHLSRASSPTLYENNDNDDRDDQEYRVTGLKPKVGISIDETLRLFQPPKITSPRNCLVPTRKSSRMHKQVIESMDKTHDNIHPDDVFWTLEAGDLFNDTVIMSEKGDQSADVDAESLDANVIATERLHGVVEGMKLWPELSCSAFVAEVSIENLKDGEGNGVGRRLHSRFYQ